MGRAKITRVANMDPHSPLNQLKQIPKKIAKKLQKRNRPKSDLRIAIGLEKKLRKILRSGLDLISNQAKATRYLLYILTMITSYNRKFLLGNHTFSQLVRT